MDGNRIAKFKLKHQKCLIKTVKMQTYKNV